MKHTALIVPVILALAGCSSSREDVDLGDDDVASVASSLEDYQGTWQGYAEAFEFDSAGEEVRITLDQLGQGSIAFGHGDPLPPFSDPQVGYPESDPFDTLGFFPSYDAPRSGFEYPVHDATVDDGRIRFIAWGTDLVADWCAAQPSYYDDANQPAAYTCSPAGRSFAQGDEGCFTGSALNPTVHDCGVVKICMTGCECDESSCAALHRPGDELKLDGALESVTGNLVGTLVVNDDRVTVRLVRQ
jgi:hypothetical protein